MSMEHFEKNLNKIYNENINSIRVTRRQFYPRNFELSQEFVDAFVREYKRLLESGQKKTTLLEKMSKALKFHLK